MLLIHIRDLQRNPRKSCVEEAKDVQQKRSQQTSEGQSESTAGQFRNRYKFTHQLDYNINKEHFLFASIHRTLVAQARMQPTKATPSNIDTARPIVFYLRNRKSLGPKNTGARSSVPSELSSPLLCCTILQEYKKSHTPSSTAFVSKPRQPFVCFIIISSSFHHYFIIISSSFQEHCTRQQQITDQERSGFCFGHTWFSDGDTYELLPTVIKLSRVRRRYPVQEVASVLRYPWSLRQHGKEKWP